jgi:hypothetical protein
MSNALAYEHEIFLLDFCEKDVHFTHIGQWVFERQSGGSTYHNSAFHTFLHSSHTTTT